MGPKNSNSSYSFDRPERIRDRTKKDFAGHRDRRLSENYFEPCATTRFIITNIFTNVFSCEWTNFLRSVLRVCLPAKKKKSFKL